MKKELLHKGLFLAIIMLGTSVIYTALAQGPPPPPPPAPGVPIDGAIGLLIAAATAYGAKKVYDSKKDEEAEVEVK